MKTRVELVHEALKNLGYLPEGVTPDAETYAMVDGRLDGVLEELQAKDILYVPDSDEFKEEHFGPLGHILANACKARFGAPGDSGFQAEADKAERDLNAIEAQPYTGAILKTQYF